MALTLFRPLMIASLLAASPALAAERWTHEATGVSIDTTAGSGLALGEERDLSEGRKLDLILQFGDAKAGEPATLYLYRSTFPNPALWFERTAAAMAINLGGLPGGATPVPFTLGDSPQPNGLRMAFDLPPGGNFRSTAVAMAQVGEWMIKFRATSRSLDAEALGKRLDALISAVHLSGPVAAPHPLTLPARCDSDGFDGGKPVEESEEKGFATAALEGAAVMVAAHGGEGLAAAPDQWCRAGSELPPNVVSVYRRQAEPAEWVMLVGDAGLSLVGHALPPSDSKAKAALYANRLDSTHVVALYDSLPFADTVAEGALPVLLGQRAGLVSISSGPAEGAASAKAR